jgi:hypothetical protein
VRRRRTRSAAWRAFDLRSITTTIARRYLRSVWLKQPAFDYHVDEDALERHILYREGR